MTPPPEPVNLLNDPGFELTPTLWTLQDARAQIVDDKDAYWVKPQAGERMLRLPTRTKAISEWLDVSDAAALDVTFYANTYDSERFVDCRIEFDGAPYSGGATHVNSGGPKWKRFTFRAVKPSQSISRARVVVSTNTADVRVDSFTVTAT